MVSRRAEREAGAIWKVVNDAYSSNTYICATGAPGDCFLVDPGLDGPAIEEALAELGFVPRAILCTHGHFDHAGTAAFFQNKYRAPVYLHGDDVKTLKASNFLLTAFKRPERVQIPKLDTISIDGSDVRIGDRTVRYHATPGHTPGSCILAFEGALFTGDTLFARNVGMSQLPGEDPELLRKSIRAIWDRFPEEAVVLPGHGRSTSFGSVKQDNHKLLDFMRMATASQGGTPS